MSGDFSRETAEILALKALAWLAAMPDDIGRFLNFSGIDPATLASRAEDPEFLAAVMDFVLSDDKLLTAFTEEEGIDPPEISLMRRALPGG